jgi:hypothetical protein
MQTLLRPVFFILLLGLSMPGQAQFLRKLYKDSEIYGGLATTSYFGDIGGKDSRVTGVRRLFDNLDIDLWQVRFAAIGGVRLFPLQNLAISAQISPMFVGGNDLRSNYAWRGYAFNTFVLETSIMGEYYLADRITGVAPFVQAGLSGMFYTFKNNVTDKRSRLYSTGAVVAGVGTRLPGWSRVTHSIDAAFHFTWTDFLDGYNTDMRVKDIFFLLSYKMNLQLYTQWYYDHKGLVR